MNTNTIPMAKDDTARCQNKTEKGRQCRLVVHAGDKHVYVNRSREHKSLSEVVPAGFTLKASEVTDRLKKENNRSDTKPRDADQKRIDAEAKVNYGKNVKASHNTKTPWEKVILSEYIVPPRAVDVVLDYLRRASGTGGTVSGAQLRYRKGTHASGNTRIQWAFLAKAPKE